MSNKQDEDDEKVADKIHWKTSNIRVCIYNIQ